MRSRKPLPTQERLRELFDYHPDGYFVRRVDVGFRPCCAAGEEVRGSPMSNGFLQVRVDGGRYLMHRLVYAWHHGDCPEDVHPGDWDRGNCRAENLTPSDPAMPQRRTGSGARNVYPNGRTFRVVVGNVYRGNHATLEEAMAHAEAARRG